MFPRHSRADSSPRRPAGCFTWRMAIPADRDL